ncbi:MAG: BamA/TamA family outer membrane protein [Acidaminococcaceae bacterium]|nr:BamA/TamA family outer membrane protein [Acidaminococcaceae bacterium]
MSESLKRKKKPSATASQKQEPVQIPTGGTAGPVVSGTNRLNLPPIEKPVPGQDITAQNEAVSDITPYLNKTLTKISVEGNQEISTEDIQKQLISIPGLPLTEEDVNKDLQAIYNMGWFSDLYPTYEVVPEGVQVTYHVLENPNFSHLEVSGNTKISTEKIRNIVNLRQGQMVNIREATRKLQYVEDQYKRDGYILARITDVNLQPDGTLAVQINEGTVEDFKVKGNVKTKDKVILREIRLKKGEAFNSKLARRSIERIQNLGFFEDVNMKLNPGREPNAVEMEIDVVEQNTGTFGIGAGYSSADGFIGMITVGDKNLRGTGDSVMLRWEFGGVDNRNYEFTYTKPWLDKKETSISFSVYDLTYEYADYDRNGDEIARYDKERRGQEITFGRPQGEFVKNYISLKHRDDIYKGVSDGYENSLQYYEPGYPVPPGSNIPADYMKRREENFGTTNSISFSRVYDSRDNVFDPHAGKRNSYTFEWAGLGGDFKYEKLSVNYRYYLAMRKNRVLAFDLAAGYAWGNMPLSQRFAVGGADTLRGYKDDQFRGNSMLRGTVEYRIPIQKKIQAVLFYDIGYAWDKRDQKAFDLGLMESGYGVGLRINSPLGPIKLDYGKGKQRSRFHFSFGGQF